MFFDPLYLLVAIPPLLLGMWAQYRVKGNFNKYAKVATMRGMSGAQVARALLDAYGLQNVKVERVAGNLTDHYDPRSRTLRLSEATHDSPSVAAAGIAAHEMGHALQHAQSYGPLTLRSALVPVTNFGAGFGPYIFMGGLLLNFTAISWLGIALFAAATVFSLVTLPVEFDATKRAKALLVKEGIMDSREMEGVNKVLDAAALTYVAAAIQSVATLLYFVARMNRR